MRPEATLEHTVDFKVRQLVAVSIEESTVHTHGIGSWHASHHASFVHLYIDVARRGEQAVSKWRKLVAKPDEVAYDNELEGLLFPLVRPGSEVLHLYVYVYAYVCS